MDRVLIVVNPLGAGRGLLSEAGAFAAGVGADLVALRLVNETEYTSAVERTAESSRYGDLAPIDELTEEARRFTAGFGNDVTAGVGVIPLGVVGRPSEVIFETAEEYGCDHVFVVGFDGPVCCLRRTDDVRREELSAPRFALSAGTDEK